MTTHALTTDSAPAQGDHERDRRLEVLLDELVTVPREDELPADFARKVLESRPFAPWEVSRTSCWRLPLGIGLGFLAGSLGLALTPLWNLGPSTALTVWAELLAAAFGRPAAAFVAALPLLVKGTGRAAESVSPATVASFGAVAGAVAASLGVALGRLRRPASSAARLG